MRRELRDLFRTFCLGLALASLLAEHLAASGLGEKGGKSSLVTQKNWKQPLTRERKILHLLNRITFGPRPGDFERVRRIGLDTFLEEQLHPERIDDAAVGARVAALPTLSMSTEQLLKNFPEPKPVAPVEPPQGLNCEQASSPKSQGQAMKPMQRPEQVVRELAQEELLRAIYSNRQLQEEMVQFWMNHFNIFAPKGADRWLLTSFERDAIRPHALGKFEDLLVATAESPAMLFYLDNWLSAAPNPPSTATDQKPPTGQGKPAAPQSRRGINENYGRELMELHTLGVDGGYTQKDVIEVARCFTGWTIDRPQQAGRFLFNPRMHDSGEKTVLGHKIPAGQGIEDGLEVLHLLAHHPSTARFISLKLCRRFVADEPPKALVDRASQVFVRTDGDLRAVLKTILTSPQFYSKAAFRAKAKSPLELMASSVRALEGETDAGQPLLQLMARLGQPMFQYLAPTGFPDRASAWINSSTLLMRMNYAMMLASNRIPGSRIALQELALAPGSDSEVLAKLSRQLLGETPAPKARQALLARVADNNGPKPAGTESPRDVSALVAFLLASPEFQER